MQPKSPHIEHPDRKQGSVRETIQASISSPQEKNPILNDLSG